MSEIRVPAWSGSGESPLLGYSLRWGKAQGDESCKDTNPIHEGSTLITSFNCNHFPQAPPPNIFTLGDRISTYESHTDIQWCLLH